MKRYSISVWDNENLSQGIVISVYANTEEEAIQKAIAESGSTSVEVFWKVESVSRVYLGNAFSLQMINLGLPRSIKVCPVDRAEVAAADFESVVGHADTAAVLSTMLGKPVACNRASITLEHDDVLYVAQLTGGRLPEGSTTLPEGFHLDFVRVELV